MFRKEIGTIGIRLLVFSIVGSLLIFTIVSTLAIIYEYRQIRDDTLESLEILANSTRSEIKDLLKYLQARVTDFSSDGRIKSSLRELRAGKLDRVEITDRLNDHLTKSKLPIFPEAFAVSVLDLSGVVIASSDPMQVNKNLSLSKWYTESQKEATVSDLARDPGDGEYQWFATAPIIDATDGVISGTIVARLDYLSTVNVIITGSRRNMEPTITAGFKRLRQTGETYIVNRDKLIITESRFLNNVILKQVVDTKPINRGIKMRGIYLGYRDVPVFGVSSQRLGELGWTVLAEIDRTEALEPIRSFLIALSIIGVVMIPIVSYVSFTITKSFVELLTERDHNQRELEQTVDQLQQQAEENVSLQAQLQAYTNQLEETVNQRTQALQKAQSQLVQAEKLSAIGRLSAGVAHEINNPMAVISTCVEGLQSQLITVDTPETLKDLPEYLASIRDAAYRCKEITQKLLTFSRQTALKFTATDVNHLIQEIVSLVGYEAEQAHKQVVLNFEPDLPVIQADRDQLGQAFLNFTLNALDAMSADNRLEICTNSAPDEASIEICFQDTGSGIPTDVLNKIFEPFYTTKGTGRGTGLGLAICQGIIEAHFGRIQVESRIGVGTQFHIHLPIQEKGRRA